MFAIKKSVNPESALPRVLRMAITASTTDEEIEEFAGYQGTYNFHVVENLLFLERRVAQLEEQLKKQG